MKDRISIDGAGRVVLPKPVREHLQLRQGDVLSLELKGDAIELRPATASKIRRVNGVMVYVDSGTLPAGVDFTADAREERISDVIKRGAK